MKTRSKSASSHDVGRLQRSIKVAANQRVSPDSFFGDPKWYMKKLVTTPGVPGSQIFHVDRVPGYPGGFALALAEYVYARMNVPVIEVDREVEWLTAQNEVNGLNTVFRHFWSLGRRDLGQVERRDWVSLLAHLQSGAEKVRTKARITKIIEWSYRLWQYSSRLTVPLSQIPFGLPQSRIIIKPNRSTGENRTPPIPDAIFSALLSTAFCYTQQWSETIISSWLEMHECWRSIERENLSRMQRLRKFWRQATKVVAKKDFHWRLKPLVGLQDLLDEVYQLRNAAMIVVLAISGIRGSELLSIKSGCCVPDLLPSGEKVWFLDTVLHKHHAGGKADTWVVVEEVVQAVKILETLTQFIRAAAKDDSLLLSNEHFPFYITGNLTEYAWKPYSSASIIYQIASFADHSKSVLGRNIPNHTDGTGNSVDWQFDVRQFRRTLAKHIVRQPFGMIAGMLQYKHVGIHTFQGYAGTEPEWNRMLEEEGGLFDVDVLGEVALDLALGEVAGGLASQLMSELHVDFQGQAMDASAAQIAKWLVSKSRTVHVGKFNLCLFDPSAARCVDHDAKAAAPVLNACDPGVCGNSCVGKKHLPLWQAQLDQTIDFLRTPKIPASQRGILKREASRIRNVMMLAKDRQ